MNTPEKKQLSLASSMIGCALALGMPHRARIYFTFFLNFIHNRLSDTVKIVLVIINTVIAQILIFIVYFLVMGICAVFARISRRYCLTQPRIKDTYFRDKEPIAPTLETFLTQY